MAEWCMAHPYMTFWIAITAIFAIDNMVNNIARLIAVCCGKSEERPESLLGKDGE